MSKHFNESAEVAERMEAKSAKLEERISIPKWQVNKLKNILLYILERCAGKPNFGETVLYKLLYFWGFNYNELYGEHLTGAKYRKLPCAPVPQKLDAVSAQMIQGGQLQSVKSEYRGFIQTRYFPLEKAVLTEWRTCWKEIIDKVINQISDWSAAGISNYSHKDMPWLASKEAEEISYE